LPQVAAVRDAHVEHSSLDLRRDGYDLLSEAWRGEKLPVQERRMVNREEESADSARLHHFDIEAFGENRYRSSTHQSLAASLGEHRLSDREQHDHHCHADTVSEEQEE